MMNFMLTEGSDALYLFKYYILPLGVTYRLDSLIRLLQFQEQKKDITSCQSNENYGNYENDEIIDESNTLIIRSGNVDQKGDIISLSITGTVVVFVILVVLLESLNWDASFSGIFLILFESFFLFICISILIKPFYFGLKRINMLNFNSNINFILNEHFYNPKYQSILILISSILVSTWSIISIVIVSNK